MKWTFLVAISVALISCSGDLQETSDRRGEALVDEASVSAVQRSESEEISQSVQDERRGAPGLDQRPGQVLYIPVYSHVYWGSQKRPFNMACTLSVRNTDMRSPITLASVEYFDTTGKLVRAYVSEPTQLAPLETQEFYVEERDTSGGSGANFIVRWVSDSPVNAPIVEALMIGVEASQGISFLCPAQEIFD